MTANSVEPVSMQLGTRTIIKEIRIQTLEPRRWLLIPAIALLAVLGACGGEAAPATPSPEIATPIPTAVPGGAPQATPAIPVPTEVPPPTVARVATATPTPAVPPLHLDILSPQDGAGVETGAVRVLGRTRVDAAVGINGIPVDVAADGTFHFDLALDNGANLLEVGATDLTGDSVYQQVLVFSTTTTAGLPFSLFYPPDGLSVAEGTVPVAGGARPDAVVGVNGSPVEVNALGIFSTVVTLEEGANFIEVVATDIDGNVRFQTAVVFYLP